MLLSRFTLFLLGKESSFFFSKHQAETPLNTARLVASCIQAGREAHQ